MSKVMIALSALICVGITTSCARVKTEYNAAFRYEPALVKPEPRPDLPALPADATEGDFTRGVDPLIQHGARGWDRVETLCRASAKDPKQECSRE